MKRATVLLTCAVCGLASLADGPFRGHEYDFTRQRLFSGFDGKFCKIAPEVASDGHGLALMTWEKLLLTGSDVFYGTYLARSEDDGLTWGEPIRQEILADTWEGEIRVARNACIRYSAKNRRWFALGHESLYKDDKRPFQQVVNGRPFMRPLYVSVDAARGALTNVTYLAFPFACAGAMPFGQIAECDNGDIIVPFYLQEKGADPKNPYVLISKCVTVRYAFEDDALKVVKAGTPISVPGLLRGVGEPSLVRAGSKFYITLRSDERGMFAESDDGLTFGEPQPWRWENGEEIGNRNTQQHWIHGANAIYLAYTRETPWNGHVFRNRAPIFAAKFDPVRKCLVRETEFALTPELGTRSGNFCIADVRDESWLVTAEWMQGLNGALGTCERYGADNSLWLVKTRFGGKVGGRRNLLMSGETPPAAVVEMLPKVAAAMGCELEVTVEGKTLPEHPATGRWDYVTMRRPFVDFQKMRNEGAQFCLRYANALPKAEIVVVEPLDYAQHRGAYDFANEKSLRVAPVGTAARLLDGMAGGVVDANAPKYAYLESLVWVAKLFEVDVSGCPWAPPALAADEAKRICRAAQDAVNGVAVPPEKGGAVIPPDVAAGMARIRASDEPRCRVREVEYSPERGVRVFLQLKPTTISTIRCEVRLPDPRKWDGRFWGNGCGGWPEMRTDYIVNPSDSVEMKCDMGTLRFPIGKAPVHPEVRKDFGWRATHLSTLAAKRLVKLFYGRDPDHSYFYGSSTGGRQATAEARRFPADYDGVIAGVPALEPVCHAMPGWRIAQLKRTYGTWFTPEQIKAVRQAELDYFAKTDPEIARGKFICDPLPTKEKLDGCWAEALKSDPSIAPLEKMWRELFEPITACGRRLCPGFVIGAEFNAPNSASEFMLDSILGAKPLPEATEADLVRLQDDADYTMRDADLTAFAARGGKFITFAGLEDGSIPPLPVTEHYCRAVGTLGAAVVTNFFVHYLIPGRQHSPGRWSAHGATGDPANLRGTIQDWVEKGVRPNVLTVPFLDEPGKAIKIAPYPSVGVVRDDSVEGCLLSARGTAEKPAVVRIPKGVHALARTLELGPENSHLRIIGDEGAVLCGGETVRFAEANGLWRAKVPKDVDFKLLYVNGRRATRAVEPDVGAFYFMREPVGDDHHGFRANPADVAPFVGKSEAELKDVELFIWHSWDTVRFPPISVAADGTVTTKEKRWAYFLWRTYPPRYRIENFREALDTPGEWYLDRKAGELLYMPRPGERIETTTAVYPRVDILLRIDGRADARVEDVTFENIRFELTDASFPTNGCISQSAAACRNAAVTVDRAKGIRFENCTFTRLGQHGVWFRDDCHDSSLVRSRVEDIGSGAVRIGSQTWTNALPRDVVTSGIVVRDCILRDGGRWTPEGCGVLLQHARDCEISHNEIAGFYYTGVSLGWTWGYRETCVRNITVAYNHIHHLGWGYLADMAAIYSLGDCNGSRIVGNCIHDILPGDYSGWGAHGLYTDEGSHGIVLASNFVRRASTGFYQHYGRDNVFRDNVFADPADSFVHRGRNENHLSFVCEGNVFASETSRVLYSGEINGGALTDKALFRTNTVCAPNRREKAFFGRTFDAWQAKGEDAGTRFVDSFDIDAAEARARAAAGVRGPAAWCSLAAREYPKMFPPPNPPRYSMSYDEGFEKVEVEAAKGMVGEFGASKGLAVVAGGASEGARFLRATVTEGLDVLEQPRLELWSTGTDRRSVLEFDFRADPDVAVAFEFQHANPIGKPQLMVNEIRVQGGTLSAGGRTVGVPTDGGWWRVRVEHDFTGASPVYSVFVLRNGKTLAKLENLPIDPSFTQWMFFAVDTRSMRAGTWEMDGFSFRKADSETAP